jgi:hypothetical protein
MKTKIMMQVLNQLSKWNCSSAVGKIIIKNFIAHNGFGLGEGGLVGCSNLAECVCPLLPNPC